MYREKTARVTQKDIARHLSVSQSLVAAVLNERPGVWVSEENRQRIRRAAVEMHYRPNAAARSLRSGRARCVGFAALTDRSNYPSWQTGQIITALAGFLGAREYDLKLKFCPEQAQMLHDLTELVRADVCDVIILAGTDANVAEQGNLLASLDMPFLVIGDQSEKYPDWLGIDFDQAGMMAVSVQRLAALGRRRIAFLGYETDQAYAALLERGFSDAVARHSGFIEDYVLMEHVRPGEREDSKFSARHHVNRWLALPAEARPDALVFGASDDDTWREAELTFLRHGIRFGDEPGEIATVGLRSFRGPLLFGEAWAFLQTDLGKLTDVLCERMLTSVLERKTPEQTFLRICPELQPLPTLNLGEYHV